VNVRPGDSGCFPCRGQGGAHRAKARTIDCTEPHVPEPAGAPPPKFHDRVPVRVTRRYRPPPSLWYPTRFVLWTAVGVSLLRIETPPPQSLSPYVSPYLSGGLCGMSLDSTRRNG
jgi:hypothetical protein